MATEVYSGTATIGSTEWSLSADSAGPVADTTPGTYVAEVDCAALAVGDLFRVKMYEKVISGATQRAAYSWDIAGPLSNPLWISPANLLIHGWDFTIQKVSGTDRSISWSIRNPVIPS